ncbi:MAG TPA: MauE/DoxX family redox-associated membrane protein, partial [Acidimicrobiales bacterium]|nr:MauE/DoxX family redox-associated membrane protein [Acidimicrobiales bacterium]
MTGAVLVAALLLVWAGLAKAWRPSGTGRALRSVGLPSSDWAVRAIAAVEAAIGAGAILAGGAFDVAMAVSYAGFAVWIGVALRRRWPLSSCGCFGVADARPTVAHLVADGALAGVALVAAASRTDPVRALARHPAQGAAAVLLATVTA